MKNNKGFTLVELLAVIVVLALLMVVATSSIGGALNNAKKNTLKTEAQKMLTEAFNDITASYMLSSNLNSIGGKVVHEGTNYSIVEYVDGDYKGYFRYVDTETDDYIEAYCVRDEKNNMSLSDIYDATSKILISNSDFNSPSVRDVMKIKVNDMCSFDSTGGDIVDLT